MPDQQISTRCENPAKVRLVGWFWAPPGTKSGVKCAWCVWVFQFKRPLPPKEQEAFYVSRGFPFLMVAASNSGSIIWWQSSENAATL
jgi:hypothetical protein